MRVSFHIVKFSYRWISFYVVNDQQNHGEANHWMQKGCELCAHKDFQRCLKNQLPIKNDKCTLLESTQVEVSIKDMR